MPTYRHLLAGPGTAGDIWNVTMHSDSPNPIDTVHGAWWTMINGFLMTSLLPLWSATTAASQVVTWQLDPGTGKSVLRRETFTAWPGTGAGGTPSPRNSLLIGLSSVIPGRGGRGRMYFPSLDASHYTTAGDFDTATCAGIETQFRAEMATFKTVSNPVIYHRATRTIDTITTVRVDNVVATQQRRTNKSAHTYASGPV